MRVGIVGSGLMGGKLGTLFPRARHEVLFSYARRYTEPFGLLVAQLAYEGKGGPELAYGFERFER